MRQDFNYKGFSTVNRIFVYIIRVTASIIPGMIRPACEISMVYFTGIAGTLSLREEYSLHHILRPMSFASNPIHDIDHQRDCALPGILWGKKMRPGGHLSETGMSYKLTSAKRLLQFAWLFPTKSVPTQSHCMFRSARHNRPSIVHISPLYLWIRN